MGSVRSKHAVWLVALAAMLLPEAEVYGQALYKTKRVLEQKGNACLGASACATLEAEAVSVDAGASTSVQFRCPGDHPYFLGWDATRHEHITVGVVAADAGGLTLVVGNGADAAGSAKVYLGCADRPLRATSYLQSVGSIPTNRRAVIRNAP
jgi:hypothetical protein